MKLTHRRERTSRSVLDIAAGDSPAATPATEPSPSAEGYRWLPAIPVVRFMLPAIALILTLCAAWLRWNLATEGEMNSARTESVRTAAEVTVSLLSYRSETADTDLRAAETRLTGTFREAYRSLIDEVVIPGAQQKQIVSTAAVPAASLVSINQNRSVVLVFVDQTITFGGEAPTQSASSVRVTLDKVDGQWLISDFAPIR